MHFDVIYNMKQHRHTTTRILLTSKPNKQCVNCQDMSEQVL